MPLQPPNPLGGLGSLVDSATERARSYEARRIFYGAVLGSTVTITSPPSGSAGGYVTNGTLTITTGPTGLCVLFATGNPDSPITYASLGVYINGGSFTPVADTSGGISDSQGGFLLQGSSGVVLTPNTENTFALYWNIVFDTAPANMYSPILAVLPF